jgi:NADH:ubiquinone reductase (non-electrogenic)
MPPSPQRLLILGTGFAAFRLLRDLDLRAFRVTIVSPRNHFLFTPLLPSTCVGTIEYRTIIEPIRRNRSRLEFFLGNAESVDVERRVVRCRGLDGDVTWEQPYDFLVLAVGCVTNTFGVPGVSEHALFLKELNDARRIRERLICNLERAALPGVGDAERRRLLHFVAVGAGPTGVRFAAELYDLLATDLPRSYPALAPLVRVTLLDAGPVILGAYDEQLRAYVQRAFLRRGIAVRTASPVTDVGPTHLALKNGEVIPAGMVLWSAGFGPNPLIAGLPFEKDRAGRLLTDEFLQVRGQPGVFALGDCGHPAGQAFPQLAQVAEQQGAYLADCLQRRLRGKPVRPFAWRGFGVSSYIGEGDAVSERPDHTSRETGFRAYQHWRGAIWTQLVSARNKILVPVDRMRARLFGRDLNKF